MSTAPPSPSAPTPRTWLVTGTSSRLGRHVAEAAFAAEQGFTAIEDNFFKRRPVAEQERMTAALARHGVELGCIVNNLIFDRPTMVHGTADAREALDAEFSSAAEAARRAGGRWLTTLSGPADPALPPELQAAHMTEHFRFLADRAAQAGVTLLVEAINRRNWPGTFLTSTRLAHQIVRAVDHPHVRLVLDVFQMQVEGGDLLHTIDECWDAVAYVHLADAPRRTEPGTGEINFVNVLRHLQAKGYAGLLDMEHDSARSGKEGEEDVLRAYQRLNAELRDAAEGDPA